MDFMFREEPSVHVGILTAPSVEADFLSPYTLTARTPEGQTVTKQAVTGKQTVECRGNLLSWGGRCYTSLCFAPYRYAGACFRLPAVMIGIGFHWERTEVQSFCGTLQLTATEGGRVQAVNIVRAEDYLASVIGSEMNASSSAALLEAHAVISRSWLLAQMEQRRLGEASETAPAETRSDTETEYIRWYGRTAHRTFDVCADDHCQRYQGLERASTPAVGQAIAATRGLVLLYEGRLCDARFSKCCGGVTEEYRYCWDDREVPYLRSVADRPSAPRVPHPLPDLTQEAEAERWIRTAPTAFCHTTDRRLLRQVLNGYDQETPDFYRWRVAYAQDELASLIARRTGHDFGQIADLRPLERGRSGRISRLLIVGTQRTLVVGKELEIRRTLSPTHLYSSAFVVDREDLSPQGIPARFVLTGAGWGHGVGLCQIGAAVMADRGYRATDILHHYYPGAELCKLY